MQRRVPILFPFWLVSYTANLQRDSTGNHVAFVPAHVISPNASAQPTPLRSILYPGGRRGHNRRGERKIPQPSIRIRRDAGSAHGDPFGEVCKSALVNILSVCNTFIMNLVSVSVYNFMPSAHHIQ